MKNITFVVISTLQLVVRLQHDLLGFGALQTQKNMKNQTNKLTIAFVMCGKNIN